MAAEVSRSYGFPNLSDTLLTLPQTGPKAHLGREVLVGGEKSVQRSKSRPRAALDTVNPSPRNAEPLASAGASVLALSAREKRDGMMKSLMKARQAPPVPLSVDDVERALQELQIDKFHGPGSVPASRRTTKKPVQAPGSPAPEPSPEAERRARVLRQNFRCGAAEIKEEFNNVYKWNVLPELVNLEPQSDNKLPRQAKTLQRLWEELQLPSEIRASDVLGTDERASEQCAHKAEISACFSYLNFVRWLCGLPKVCFSPAKHLACDILCQALLPRAGFRPGGEPKAKSDKRQAVPSVQLAQELKELSPVMSILQGEGSLVSALEQGLSAHTGASEAEETPAASAYKLVAAHPELVESEGQVKRRMPAEELPEALQHLKVFWDLDPAALDAREAPKREKAKTPRREPKPPKHATLQAQHFGLNAIWGDRRGALDSRRSLLSCSLRSFAAARYDDTCVFWTSSCSAWEEGGDPVHLEALGIDAVCYPPPGLVPMALMEGRMPWTIMPDALRFQPTSATSVRVWQVRINRSGAEVAERLQEVRVLYMAVDCRGEGCCVIFWPELRIQPGLQLEVVLSGLCGARSELNIFHEFMPFRRCEADKALLAEAAQMRQLLQQAQLAQDSRPQLGPPPLQLLSHPGKDIEATSNDLLITLRCPVASLWATLMVRRFDGEFTEVLRACHAVKLRDHIFLVRVKLPLPSHYELKFSVSLPETPREVEAHPFRYYINASSKCPAIVRSLDDRLMAKYGFVKLQVEAQLSGVTIISPCKFRVPVGQVYFLVHVDQSAALQAAQDALPPLYSDSEDGRPLLFAKRLLPEDTRSPKEVRLMHEVLQEAFALKTQDAHGDIHLDLVLHNGQHIHRLRQRHDLPCLFESLLNVSEVDNSTKVQLVLRFPKAHACDFSPRRVAEWTVSRQDRVHDNF
mmetsp:Transcript_92494/g.220109  ORF Transcript_92494/g.220109 Transcript_92494/m.220109 type:complete len:919 (+) Transcript_92494:73-2829(+)|eukprot:CAMPEP_0181454340 /NCGR_PEP_ID=MMETSP1110-20121109/30187_1 /TAXON_ID=174948 /ORGANISM="Symbiodinium sp., Strain CCMP421" /LENGTH=918 /DNA_ID=CAMNT_0023578681 /DNA_START=71 /DNA_END=2827 /DNA_ORIENTATION=+